MSELIIEIELEMRPIRLHPWVMVLGQDKVVYYTIHIYPLRKLEKNPSALKIIRRPSF